jgi:hypothetical protein
LTLGGVKVALVPAGSPVTLNAIGRALPDVTDVVTVYVVLWPCITVWLDGLALMAKSLRGRLPGCAR